MATEQILVEYVADIQGFRAQLKSVENTLNEVKTTAKKSAEETTKHFQSTSSSIKDGATQIAGALGLAFGVHKVIEFGKESIKAFAEAEVNANKLKFALDKIGGEGNGAFKKLIEQSEKLQKSTIFSDDAIQQSQTALVQFGLTSEQVAALIPQIADLASATGTDLASATQKAIQGINGQTRGLKEVGISYVDTGSKTENLALLTDKLTKFNGASADAMETVTGKAKRLENAFGDIQEKIGEYLVNEGAQILDNFEVVFGGKADEVNLRRTIEKYLAAMDGVNEKTLEKAKLSEVNRLNAIVETNNNILALYEQRGKQENFQQQKVIDAQIKNQKKLNEELRNLNKLRKIEDDATMGGAKGAQKDADAELKIKEESLQALINLDIKADEASLTQTAKTESEKIELARGRAIQEVLIAEKAAIDAGNARIDAEGITQNALANIRKTFDDQQATLAKTQNEKEWEDAIAEAERQGGLLADAEKKAQADRLKEVEKGAADRARVEQQLQQFVGDLLSSIGQISQNITDSQIQDVQAGAEEEQTLLQAQYDAKVITQEEYERKKALIDKKAAEEEAKLKRKQFETNKQLAIISAIINVAQGVTAALKVDPPLGFILAALVAASGALQIGVISSQPTPKFEKGGKVKGERHYAGGTLIEAERDEMIINRNDAMKNDRLLNAINSGSADKFIFDHYIAPALKTQQRKNAETKETSFAKNLANSMSLNFADGNLLDSLKQSRKNDKEIALFLASKFEGSQRSNHKW